MGKTCGNRDRTAARNAVSDEIREVFRGAADLILPYRCEICGDVSDTEDRFGNYAVLYKNLYSQDPELHICGKCLSSINASEEDKRWFLCLSNPVVNDPCPGLALYMPFTYKGLVERAIPKIKFGGKIELARLFGCLLGSALSNEHISADLIVPVPLSPERLAERGFNQASEIAYPVAKLNNIPFADDVLVRIKETKRQSEIMDINKRAFNVSGAFGVSDNWDVTGMTVIVVDDVVTSGATLHEAAVALYNAGASKALCAAFAGNRNVKNAEPF